MNLKNAGKRYCGWVALSVCRCKQIYASSENGKETNATYLSVSLFAYVGGDVAVRRTWVTAEK